MPKQMNHPGFSYKTGVVSTFLSLLLNLAFAGYESESSTIPYKVKRILCIIVKLLDKSRQNVL